MFSISLTDIANFYGVFKKMRLSKNKKSSVESRSNDIKIQDNKISPRNSNSVLSVIKHLDSLNQSQKNEIIKEDLEFENEETKSPSKLRNKALYNLRNKASTSKDEYKNVRYSLNRNPKKY